MSRLYQSLSSCLQKTPPASDAKEVEKTKEGEKVKEEAIDPEECKENDAPELSADKKTDEPIEPVKPQGLLWRVASGTYSMTTGAVTGAVGLGVGGVKWAAVKSYDAGSVVVNTTKTVASKVPVPTLRRKDKKE